MDNGEEGLNPYEDVVGIYLSIASKLVTMLHHISIIDLIVISKPWMTAFYLQSSSRSRVETEGAKKLSKNPLAFVSGRGRNVNKQP